jgi:hypothetical protein
MIRLPSSAVSRPRYYASLSNKDKNDTTAPKMNTQSQVRKSILKIEDICSTLLSSSTKLSEDDFSVVAWSQFKGALQQAQSNLQAIEKILDPARKYADPLRTATIANRTVKPTIPVDIGDVPPSLYADIPYETSDSKRVRFINEEEKDEDAKEFEAWKIAWETEQWMDDMKRRGDIE